MTNETPFMVSLSNHEQSARGPSTPGSPPFGRLRACFEQALGERFRSAPSILIAAALLIIIGCGPAASDSAKTWTTREMVANARQDKNFGGLSTRMLAVSAGDPIPWRSRPFEADDVVQGEGRGLPLWPAFAEGQTATALITEIWLNHPTPWVQPVYQFLTDGQGRSDLRGIFPVGVDSTFYTPYWRAELATVPRETTPETFKSATSLLDARVPLQKYVMVVCPIVPRDVFIAVPSGAKKAARPLSGEPVDLLDHAEAWVDDKVVTYFGVGFDRQTVTEQELPIETPIYFFVKTPGSGKPSFTLPPVLPNQPARHSLHRRYEVTLPAGALDACPEQLVTPSVVRNDAVTHMGMDWLDARAARSPLFTCD